MLAPLKALFTKKGDAGQSYYKSRYEKLLKMQKPNRSLSSKHSQAVLQVAVFNQKKHARLYENCTVWYMLKFSNASVQLWNPSRWIVWLINMGWFNINVFTAFFYWRYLNQILIWRLIYYMFFEIIFLWMKCYPNVNFKFLSLLEYENANIVNIYSWALHVVYGVLQHGHKKTKVNK